MNNYDHTLGRLDALFEEARWLRKEVESMKVAEQARVSNNYAGQWYCKECDDWFVTLHGHPAKPAPVVERFVMWDYTTYLLGGTEVFTRHRRGDVVARKEQVCTNSGRDYCGMPGGKHWDTCPNRHNPPEYIWAITFPDGCNDWVEDRVYQRLKRNGCFGEQV